MKLITIRSTLATLIIETSFKFNVHWMHKQDVRVSCMHWDDVGGMLCTLSCGLRTSCVTGGVPHFAQRSYCYIFWLMMMTFTRDALRSHVVQTHAAPTTARVRHTSGDLGADSFVPLVCSGCTPVQSTHPAISEATKVSYYPKATLCFYNHDLLVFPKHVVQHNPHNTKVATKHIE